MSNGVLFLYAGSQNTHPSFLLYIYDVQVHESGNFQCLFLTLCRGAVWCALGVPVQRQLSGLSVAEWESSPPPPPGGATEHNVSHSEDRNPRTGWGDLPECPPKRFISNSFWFLLISTVWLKKYKKSIPIEVVWLQHCSKYLLMSSSEESKSYILSGVS